MSAPAPELLFVEGQTSIPVEGEVLDREVTLDCDECGDKFTGPAGGKGSASFLLGKHRWSAHGIKMDGTRKAPAKGRGRSVEVIEPDGSLVGTLHEAASQVTGSGTPSAANLARAFGYLANTATLTAAGWAVDSHPGIAAALQSSNEAQAAEASEMRDNLVRALTLDAKQAETLAKPFARLLAPTALNKKYGRHVVDNSDVGPALAVLVEVGRNWREFSRERGRYRRELRALQAAQAEVRAGTPATAPPPPMPAPPAPTAPADPTALGSGRVAQPTYRTQ